ncbi:uncharacterized protein LOC125229860 [Leguminivora glycinivorella]|uniref:uncharacterized protein LOC125229860 n=1 Tax=Leguminivora glycinivorella TaxID=1035111 RepID=UPI00200E9E49|nr:uncharacterized protein LOC125229860 [Leguminivora glycinivorella]
MINDLPGVVRSAGCLLFADDLKLFLGIENTSDQVSLQRDIDAVAEWSETNQLHFNTSKCKVIAFSRSRVPLVKQYNIKETVLDRVDEITDLGLTLDTRLNFRTHVTNICKKANRVLGFIMRVSSQFSDTRVSLLLYSAYVRSKLEFGACVWDPHESKYTLMIEKIQRKFARFLYKRKFGFYPYLYPSLFVSGMVGLDTLELRRKMLLLGHFYKLLCNQVSNPTALARIGLSVPPPRRLGVEGEGGAVVSRRRRRLFACPSTRTRWAANAPLQELLLF